jgi:predicted nucleic acid-binding protein
MKVAVAFRGVGRIFLDTAPVIYHVEGFVPLQPVTDWVFQQIQAAGFRAVASPITLAECLVRPYQLAIPGLIQQFRAALQAGTGTTYFSIDHCADAAAELRARYGLSLPDGFQIAAAVASGCDAFLTNDLGLKRVTELPILALDELEV